MLAPPPTAELHTPILNFFFSSFVRRTRACLVHGSHGAERDYVIHRPDVSRAFAPPQSFRNPTLITLTQLELVPPGRADTVESEEPTALPLINSQKSVRSLGPSSAPQKSHIFTGPFKSIVVLCVGSYRRCIRRIHNSPNRWLTDSHERWNSGL